MSTCTGCKSIEVVKINRKNKLIKVTNQEITIVESKKDNNGKVSYKNESVAKSTIKQSTKITN